MAEPFKNAFNASVIRTLGEHLARHQPDFVLESFVSTASADLEALELKARATQIAEALILHLPQDFERCAEVITACLGPEPEEGLPGLLITDAGVQGWMAWPLGQVVVARGMAHFDLSLQVLNALTRRFTAEFAVRFFIIAQPERALTTLRGWLDDESPHVRRLVSEGTRPRLPWSMRLPMFIKDPSPLLPILEALRDDPSEYVRRSVANNLNDIAKDHPDLVAQVARDWLVDAPPTRERLVKHACRTLIKQGHRGALEALGYGPPQVDLMAFEIKTATIQMGEAVVFEVRLRSTSTETQALILDYAVHHVKANGSRSAKVFKWKNWRLKAGQEVTLERKHKIKPITTRRYYPGVHRVEVLLNGESLGSGDFVLEIPTP